MLWRVSAFFVVSFLLGTPPLVSAGQPTSSGAPPELPQYLAELDQWSAAVSRAKQNPREAAALRKQLPPAWSVTFEGQRYEIPTEWLRGELESIEKHPRSAASCEEIQLRLQALRAAALQLRGSTAVPSAEARRKLDEILKRREFRDVHGPTWLDQLRDRVARWLLDLLQKLFGRLNISPGTSRILVWCFIVAAALAVAVWLLRRLLAGQAPLTLALAARQQTAKSWQERAREAFSAARRGNFRDAVRLAYWAGVYRLEEIGLWKTDRTRTHREYLRLLPSSHPQRDSFVEITNRFELVWYAKRESSADDFEMVVSNLEKLGCEFPSNLATEPS